MTLTFGGFCVHETFCSVQTAKRAGDFYFGFQWNAKTVFDSRIWTRLAWVVRCEFFLVREIYEISPLPTSLHFSNTQKLNKYSDILFDSLACKKCYEQKWWVEKIWKSSDLHNVRKFWIFCLKRTFLFCLDILKTTSKSFPWIVYKQTKSYAIKLSQTIFRAELRKIRVLCTFSFLFSQSLS